MFPLHLVLSGLKLSRPFMVPLIGPQVLYTHPNFLMILIIYPSSQLWAQLNSGWKVPWQTFWWVTLLLRVIPYKPMYETSAMNILQSRLNASTNISATMDRVAEAMTNTFRDRSNLTIQGQSGIMELYIRVSWLWLALPVFSSILGKVILISVMTMTRKHKLPVWKTSELALLFHDLDFSLPDTVKMHKASEMEEVAMGLQVRLRQGPTGELQLQRRTE